MNNVFGQMPRQLARSLRSAGLAASHRQVAPTWQLLSCCAASQVPNRTFSFSAPRRKDSAEEKAKKLNQQGLDEHEQQVKVREHQVKRPWHREDADKPPVEEEGKRKKEPLTRGTSPHIFAPIVHDDTLTLKF